MLIAITGSDGAGKSTVSRRLVEALVERGVDAIRLERFDILRPDRSSSAELLRGDVEVLRGHTLRMPTVARLLFYLWCYALPVSELLARRKDDARRVVVLDSYWMKHLAAEIVYGCDPMAAQAVANLLPRPQLVIYLRLAPEQLFERKTDDLVAYECGLDDTCSKESFIAHQEAIQSWLNTWAAQDEWLAVNAGRSVDAIVADLVAAIAHRFPTLEL